MRRTIAVGTALAVVGLVAGGATAATVDTPPPTVADQTLQADHVVADTGQPASTAPITLPATVLVPARSGDKHDGSRSDTGFYKISRTGDNQVPEVALHAYRNAAATLARSDASCHLPWQLLAGIGRVESDHGQFGGAVLDADGVSHPAIFGPQLNGAGPYAAIRDTDHGALDGDGVWDRAVGPMQFLPSTWRAVAARDGADGDGDGVANPQDINDAALAAAHYLCDTGANLSTAAGQARAIFRYNPSDYYVSLVMSYVRGYQTGVFAQPSPPADSSTSTRSQARSTADESTSASTHSPKPAHRPGLDAAAEPAPVTEPAAPATTKPSSPTGSSDSGGTTSTSQPTTQPSSQPSSQPTDQPSTPPTADPTPTTTTATGTLQTDATQNPAQWAVQESDGTVVPVVLTNSQAEQFTALVGEAVVVTLDANGNVLTLVAAPVDTTDTPSAAPADDPAN